MLVVSLMALFAVGAAVVNAAQPTVTNGTFDLNVNGWTANQYGTLSWNSTDAGGQAASGSARLDSQTGASPIGPTMSTCVAVTAGQPVQFAAKVKWLVSARKGAADAVITWVSDAACAGTAVPPVLQSNGSQYTAAGASSWQMLSATGTVPAGAQSALIRLRTVVYSASGTDDSSVGLSALFDDVTLSQESAAPTPPESSPTVAGASPPAATAAPSVVPGPPATGSGTGGAGGQPIVPILIAMGVIMVGAAFLSLRRKLF
jgi:hypothetical protein